MPCIKLKEYKFGGVAQVVEHLPNKGLSSNPNAQKKKKKKNLKEYS
jgi:hypothetical protein